MTKMSPEERQRRRDKVSAEALESVAKSEQFNFRVDAETIKRLYSIAGEQRKPVGALVREWILDRLNQEQASPSPTELMNEIHEFHRETVACLRALTRSLAAEPLDTTPSPGYTQVKESNPRSDRCRVPLPKMPEIPKSDLIAGLSSLHSIKPGYYQVPDWMIEYFKDQLQQDKNASY